MESFFSRYKNALVLLIVLVAQLLALAVQVKRPSADASDPKAVSLIRYAVVSVITPPEKLIHNVGLWFRGLWWGYVDLVHVRRDNANLKADVERLRLEQAVLAEDAKQGQRLQYLLRFRQRYTYKTLPAQVIGTSGTDQSRILYIDKGSDDGLKQDMPIITADGVVGHVKDVFPSTSQVLLISDLTSGVGVILENTRVRGVLKGAPNGQVQMVNVSPDSRIKAGEPLVTSGGDQIFPRGMPVGTVDRVVPDPDRDPLVDVLIHPAANLERLEEVLVVTSIGDMASPQSEKDLAMSEAEGLAAQKRASEVLSERLPNRVDPNAPADTNPATAADGPATGPVQMPQAPKALHPDGFSPSSVAPASAMTPGQRTVPVKYGTEDLPLRKTAPSPSSASTTSASQPATASGSAGTAVPAAPRKPVTEVDGEHPAASTAKTGAAKAGAASSGAVSGPTEEAPRTTSTSRPATSDAATDSEKPVRPATPKPQTPATGGLQPQTGTRVIVDGPAGPAQHRTQQPPAQPGAPRPTTPKPAGQGASTSGANAPKTTNPGVANPGTANSGAAKPGTATPPHRGPVLVPDDGSKPPVATKPRPEPQNPPAAPANPPQQRENR
jgi:rod shape-determining protein MreC